MRQIYNTAESPQMALFRLLDMMPSLGIGGTMPSTPTETVNMPKIEPSNGQSSCKNTSRLSLANLLPSRLDKDLYITIYDFCALMLSKCLCIH